MSGPLACSVDVATVWTTPDAPRDIDAPALHDLPDLAAWTAALDHGARLGLHGRVDTQLTAGEPVVLLEERNGWARVAAPWQPSPKDPRGYPGWVRRAHLGPAAAATGPINDAPLAEIAVGAESLLMFARRFIGLHYLWGGTSSYGVDCSGLVHLAFRAAGLVVARDADAQRAAAQRVGPGDEQPGDLYFFSRPDGFVDHVGFVAGHGLMLHAPEGSELVEEAPISAERRGRLVGAGRLLPS